MEICSFVLVVAAICSLDTVVGVIQFELSSYEIKEDIGLDDLALSVCVLADEDSTITVATTQGTATGMYASTQCFLSSCTAYIY